MTNNLLFPSDWPAPVNNGIDLTAVSPLISGAAMNLQPARPDFLSMEAFMGTRDMPGWGGAAIGGLNSLVNAFMGMKQYGIAKKTLAENKRQFNTNFDAQRQMVNSQLEDRQRARIASNPGAYQSVGEYMDRYGVKG